MSHSLCQVNASIDLGIFLYLYKKISQIFFLNLNSYCHHMWSMCGLAPPLYNCKNIAKHYYANNFILIESQY